MTEGCYQGTSVCVCLAVFCAVDRSKARFVEYDPASRNVVSREKIGDKFLPIVGRQSSVKPVLTTTIVDRGNPHRMRTAFIGEVFESRVPLKNRVGTSLYRGEKY